MNGKRVGYIRVSTVDQNPERQLADIELDKKFTDYASARSTDRPQLKALLEFVREDDIVYVHSMDRLARNLADLRNLVSQFIKMNIEVKFVKENISFKGAGDAISILLLSIMGAFAEFEYAFIRERQAEGIRIAKEKGLFKGAKKKITPEKIEIIKQEINTRKTRQQLAFELGVSTETLYKYLRQNNLLNKDKRCGDEEYAWRTA